MNIILPIKSDLGVTLLFIQTRHSDPLGHSQIRPLKVLKSKKDLQLENVFKSKKEAHEKADNTSVKTLVIPSCVFGALSPPFLVLPLYPPSSLCSVWRLKQAA